METKTGNIKGDATKGSRRYQIIPHDEKTGDQPAAPEEFNSVEEAENFLQRTKERWDGFQSIQIVDKQTGKVVDVW